MQEVQEGVNFPASRLYEAPLGVFNIYGSDNIKLIQGTQAVSVDIKGTSIDIHKPINSYHGIDMGGNKITNLAAPTSASDACRKVDLDQVNNNSKLDLSGGIMTGELDMGSNRIINLSPAISPSDACRKAELDAVNTSILGVVNTELNSRLAKSGGIMTGVLNMGSNRIVNLAAPIEQNDACRKVDLDQVNTNSKLDLSGGTMTGNISMGGNTITNLAEPINQHDACRKAELDAEIQARNTALVNKLATSGGTVTGNIDMGGNTITNLAAPTSASDACRKYDVDLKVSLLGGTMLGELDMSLYDLKVNRIKPSFSNKITAKSTEFIIDAEDTGDCKLILKADKSNLDENKNPMIIFVQDGAFEPSAIFNGDNQLNISNSISAGSGINFRCGTADNGGWLNAPIRASIDGVDGDLTLYNTLNVNTIKPTSGAVITAKSTQFIIDAEDTGDCKLILKADKSNLDDNKNPMIIFVQDGSFEVGSIFMGDNTLNISNSAGSTGIIFRCDDSYSLETAQERMSITSSGSIRMGVSNTTNETSGGLSIFGAANDTGTYASGTGVDQAYNQIYLRWPGSSASSGSGAHGWFIGNQTQTATSSDCDLYFNSQRGGVITQPGYVADGKALTLMNFTGQHRCMPVFDFTEDMLGLIVEATGRYMNLLEMNGECGQMCCITPNDAIPIVDICTSAKSKKVFGVISDKEDDEKRTFGGNFVSNYKKEKGDTRIFINSLGEGSIWVSDLNGNIENGDYITSSSLGGYGMKQDHEYLVNYTVAKATMNCNFDPRLEHVKIYKGFSNGGILWEYKIHEDGSPFLQPEYRCITLENGVKIALIGCTYHCG